MKLGVIPSGELKRIVDIAAKVVGSCLALWVCIAPEKSLGQELSQEKSSGPVTVTTRLEPSEPTIGDEVRLWIEVVAEKDVQLLMPEFGEVISGFPISEWLPSERILSDGGTESKVAIKFQVSVSGEQSIAPVLVEFVDNRPGREASPEDLDAFEILTDRIDFTVKSVLPRGAAADLKPPMPELEVIQEPTGWRWLWISLPLAAVLALLFTVVLAWKRRKQVRKANAYEVAMTRLRPLLDQQARGETVDADGFFVAISSIVRRYLEDRYDLKASDLTTDEFLQRAAGESELSNEHQSLLSEFLSQADIVKFAGVQVTRDDMKRSTDLAVRFLEETRDNAPDVILPAAGAKDGSSSSAEPGDVDNAYKRYRGRSHV